MKQSQPQKTQKLTLAQKKKMDLDKQIEYGNTIHAQYLSLQRIEKLSKDLLEVRQINYDIRLGAKLTYRFSDPDLKERVIQAALQERLQTFLSGVEIQYENHLRSLMKQFIDQAPAWRLIHVDD